ncbi:SMEK domain-containing protein [Paenibacillus rhizoplanae]|uniref:SMEK domain-containing protein n=1 Tax=Paenibacillus rhizoplanae TaxID=1917181 RepID=UPI00360FEB42
MNRDFYFTYINEKIELLSLRIKSSGKLNILNLNIHAEFFYRDLCCLLFELNLENQNTLDQNSEAIDLIDDVNKIIIQVSSTDSKQKINDTLAKNKILDYKKQGYNLKFLFFSDAKRLKTQKFNNKYDINFDASRDIIGKEDISRKY